MAVASHVVIQLTYTGLLIASLLLTLKQVLSFLPILGFVFGRCI